MASSGQLDITTGNQTAQSPGTALTPASTALIPFNPKVKFDGLLSIPVEDKNGKPLSNATKQPYTLQEFYLRGLKVSKFLWRVTYVLRFVAWRAREYISSSKLVQKLFETVVTAISRIHTGLNVNLNYVLANSRLPAFVDEVEPPKSNVDEDLDKIANGFSPGQDLTSSLGFAADILESVIPDYHKVQPHLMLSYGQVFKTGVISVTRLFDLMPAETISDASTLAKQPTAAVTDASVVPPAALPPPSSSDQKLLDAGADISQSPPNMQEKSNM